MSRSNDYQFISTDTNALVTQLIAAYEHITGITVQPASPERLFISWIADVIIQERVMNNYTGNQNIPSRAQGADLDALGELFYDNTRPAAQAALTTERFYLSEPQPVAVLIPEGTRVTDKNNTLVWETLNDAFVPIGDSYVDVIIRCQTVGVTGNNYAPGQINTLVDVFPYYNNCVNTTMSEGGADTATDDEYYALMRASMDAYSNAGSKGAYIYFAKKVSTEIADIVPNTPVAGQVNLYVLMADGTIAGEEIKSAVAAACNDAFIRPLTDIVVVADPETTSYDITFTYYISRTTAISAADIEAAVQTAVNEYVAWQSGKLGRDINPSYLMGLLMTTGIKRVELTTPDHMSLRDGSDNTAPQVAAIGAIAITNGGYEDD